MKILVVPEGMYYSNPFVPQGRVSKLGKQSMTKKKIDAIFKNLSETYETFEKIANEWDANGLNDTDFKSLVSIMLSAMTKTKRVIEACNVLFAKAETPEKILKLHNDELTELIKPVAYYNKKAKQLKKMCRQLVKNHDGKVPRTKKELLKLTGIGAKSADVLMNFNFGKDNIAVDTHVHRTLNRLGIVHTETRKITADKINTLTPKRYKKHADEWLIQHGMKVCKAKKPKCDVCSISQYCEYYGTKR